MSTTQQIQFIQLNAEQLQNTIVKNVKQQFSELKKYFTEPEELLTWNWQKQEKLIPFGLQRSIYYKRSDVMKAIVKLNNKAMNNKDNQSLVNNIDLSRDKFVFQSITLLTNLFLLQNIQQSFNFDDLLAVLDVYYNIKFLAKYIDKVANMETRAKSKKIIKWLNNEITKFKLHLLNKR